MEAQRDPSRIAEVDIDHPPVSTLCGSCNPTLIFCELCRPLWEEVCSLVSLSHSELSASFEVGTEPIESLYILGES